MSKGLSIPKEPRISLENYLLDLIQEKDGKESSVYLLDVHQFIQKLWGEMNVLNRRNLHVRKLIPESLGVHPMTLYQYKNGKKGISIQTLYRFVLLWKVYCSKTQEEFDQKWEEIYRSDFLVGSHKKHGWILPKAITPQLSYFAGWICGDGSFAAMVITIS